MPSRHFFPLMLVFAVAFGGCRSKTTDDGGPPGSATTSSPSSSSAPDRPTRSGVKPAEDDTLVTSYPNDPDTLNVVIASDTVSESFHRRVYEYLAQQDFNDPDKLEPILATDWEFDEENLEFTIHLRKGVKWHPMQLPNGQMLPAKEFTARDVKFTFDCVLNPHVEAAHIRSYYENPEAEDESQRYKIKVTVVDDYTVKVRWTEPYFLAEEFTLNGVEIIPRHVYSVDENGEPISFDFSSREFASGFNTHWANNKMCGTGPMRFKEWTRNKRLVLQRNPDYWGAPYYFSRVVARCIPNPNTSNQQVLQNELDFAAIVEKDVWIQSREHKNVVEGKVELVSFDYPGYRYLGYNLNRDLFQDKRFRTALAHAMPVNKIIKEVWKGLAKPCAGPFLPGSSASDDSIEPIPYDLDAARKLLDEAGWRDTDEDGIRDKMINNVKVQATFDFMIYSDSPSYLTIAEIFKESCRKIGVQVSISPTKWALMLEKLNEKEYDACMLGWALPWRQDPFQVFHGSQADVPDSSNHTAYSNPEVDKLIEELRITMDRQKQVQLYHQIHRLIFEDQPYTFLFVDKATAARDARLENVNFYKIRPCVDGREWTASRPRLLGP